MNVDWSGVLPAITTPFDAALGVDHAFLARHVQWLADNGCGAIIPLGSLGESATLAFEEKLAVLQTCLRSLGERVPVVAGIAALSTAEGVRLARRAAEIGCRGLMVLPPYVCSSDWREMKAHVAAVVAATAPRRVRAPLLRMDTVPKFVQLIKLAQQEVGMGSARVRPPRLELAGTELDEALRIMRVALATRPPREALEVAPTPAF